MYDVAIIGNGVVGLSAAMYSGRFNMKTLIIGELLGGTLTTTDLVENYPGFTSISSQDLIKRFKDHALNYGVDMKYGRVTEIKKDGEKFIITKGDDTFESKSVVIATGTTVKKLGTSGEKELENRGVSYCALCDGAFFKDGTVAVVGGGDGAAVDALIMSKLAKKVYMIVRKDHLKAEPTNQEKIENKENIEILYNTNIVEFMGEKKLEKVKLDNPYNGSDELSLDGAFIAIGHIMNTDLAKQLGVKLNDRDEIKIDRNARTNVAKVYAAGDCVDTHFKQAITGVSEGVHASHSAYEDIGHD